MINLYHFLYFKTFMEYSFSCPFSNIMFYLYEMFYFYKLIFFYILILKCSSSFPEIIISM